MIRRHLGLPLFELFYLVVMVVGFIVGLVSVFIR
jgi:hypothetical protein